MSSMDESCASHTWASPALAAQTWASPTCASQTRPLRLRVRFAALGLLVLLYAGGTATAPAETLLDAWKTALAQDYSLAAAESRVAAAAAGVDAARAQRLPTVGTSVTALELDRTPAFDFSSAGMPLQMPLFEDSRVMMGGATVTVPLYTSGMTGAAIDAAEAGLDAERLDAGSLALAVKLAVAERYISVLRARRAAIVAESNVASLAAHLREVEDMYQGGSVPRNDFLAAAVSLADAEQRLLQVQNALDLARAAYNRALVRPLDAQVDLDGELPPIDPRIIEDGLEALTALALAERAEPQSLEARAAVLAAQAESAAAAARPQLALTGGYTRLENEFLNRDEFWSVGIGFEWSAFDGGRARKQANALSLESQALLRQQRDLESKIALDVRQGWLMLEETEERIAVTERAVEQAEENLRVARDRYRNGEGTNSEVLDAEALRNVSLENLDAARYDAALARYRLAYAAGLL